MFHQITPHFTKKMLINDVDLNKNVKFNNKILHQSKLLNYFIKDLNNEKISKDTNEILKKLSLIKNINFPEKIKFF